MFISFIDIRDPLNLLVWGKTSPILAIGSYRGNLMIYNHKTSRRVPIIGKHTKAITCGAWSEGGLLALGSEDRSMSISNMDGDTLRVATLRDLPLDIQGRADGFHAVLFCNLFDMEGSYFLLLQMKLLVLSFIEL